MLKKLLLSLSSAILLAAPWLTGLGGWSLFVAFVPLLILQSTNPRRFGWWVVLTFVIWISLSSWWVSLATPAAIAIPIVGLFFSWTPFMLYNYISKRQSGALAWVILVTAWIAFEGLYTHQDISFPWMNLGNGFMQMPWAVQWYEYTGTFGGTLWILVSNILVFGIWENRKSLKRAIALAVWIVIPLTISLTRYFTYQESIDPMKVCILQPNIDPYNEKFDGSMTQDDQAAKLLALASRAPADVDFIITPETALDDSFWLENLTKNRRIVQIRNFMSGHYPDATMILGAMTFKVKEAGEQRHNSRSFIPFNSAIWIDSSAKTDVYFKSKLVVGAEMTPYPELFGSLKIDLGGISGDFGRQKERSVYDKVGVAICYESIYGSYFTEYIDKGAEAMFIITNDGWWGDTRGHHHHLHMARLRAIETRRDIARSANTGISAIINQRGDIVERLGWWNEGVINGTINKNTARTFYVEYKDYIVRLSVYTLALSLLYFIGQRYRAKR